MPKRIKKSLHRYLSKIKTPPSPIQLPSKKWILSGCKHPRTPSFALNDKNNTPNKKDDEATLADIDRFLHENFKSLYLDDHEEKTDNSTKNVVSEEEAPKLGPILFDSSRRFEELPHDLFVSDEGSSSTTMFSATTSEEDHHQTAVPDDCVVVLASSASPYEDFRRSMEGMVEARLRNSEKVDWDFMEELLFFHINLNQKKSHKFILSAFVDVITAIRRQPETDPPKPKPRSVRTVRIGREVRKKTKEVTLEFESL